MADMKTINIRGKEYVTVNERLKAFRSQFKDYSLIGRIVEQTADSIVFEAQIIDDKGVVRANAFSRETVGKGGVNKFAMLENAETSAWGRALGNFGIGIDTDVCTADELNAKLQHESNVESAPAKQPAPNNRTATREAEEKAPPAPDIVGKFNETFAKLQKTPDNSIDLESDKAKKQIEFMNDLLTALKAEGFNKNAEQLEKLFNQKLKKPQMAA